MEFEKFVVNYESVIEFASHRIIYDAMFLHIIHIDLKETSNILVQEYFNRSREIALQRPCFTPHRSMLSGIRRDIKYLSWILIWNMKPLYTYILPLLPSRIPSFHQSWGPNLLKSPYVPTRKNWCMSCGAF